MARDSLGQGGGPAHSLSLLVRKGSIDRQQEAAPLEDHAATIPDGGFWAWLQCIGSLSLLMNSFGLVNSFGAFQTFYEQDLLLNESTSSIAWIGSIQAFLLVGMGVVTGPLFDHGYLRSLLYTGSFLVVLGMVLTGLCSEYWQLLLSQGILVGLGSGCLFLPSVAVLPQYFKKKRGFATGIGSSGSAIGSIVFPITFNRLQPRIGFKWSVWVLALIVLVTLIIPLLTIRMRFCPLKPRRLFDTQAWKEPDFCLWAAFLFLSLLGLYLPSYYIQLYGIGIIDRDLALYLLPILNAGSFFGRLLPLYIADHLGPLNVEIPCTLTAAILAFIWIRIRTASALILFSALYGFFAGAITTITPAIDVALCPTLDVVGVRMGMLFLPWATGLLVGPAVAGRILGDAGDKGENGGEARGWMGLQLFTGTALVLAVACAVAVRGLKYGWRWSIRC